MGIRIDKVAAILNAAKEHDDTARQKGWRDDEETTKLRQDYRRTRESATQAERDLADKIL